MSVTVPAIRRVLCFTSAAFLALLSCVPLAFAQGEPQMYKTQAISAFGGFLYDHQDYTSGYDSGGAFGLDLTEHLRLPIDASLEARVNLASGPDVNEHSYVFGPVVTARLGRIRPYGDFLIGVGNIHFNYSADPTYNHDNSTVYSGGGGIEFGLAYGFRLKLDAQYQHWQLGKSTASEFTPILGTAGIAYTIPFRPFRKPTDPTYH